MHNDTSKMLSLVLLIFTVSNTRSVHGDEALVNQVCQGTPQVDVCEQCLKGGMFNSSRKDLANRSIACSFGTTGLVRTELGNYSYPQAARCEQVIGVDAWQNLENAKGLLETDHFLDAAKELTAAIGCVGECSKILTGIPVDPSLNQDLAWLLNLYVDTQAIMFQF